MKMKNSKLREPSVSLHVLGYRILGNVPARVIPFTQQVKQNLRAANIRINHIVYMSSMLFWSVIAFISSISIAFLLLEYLFPLLGFTFALLYSTIYSVLVGLTSGGVCFAAFLFYPSYKASNLKMKIEKSLVYIANYMAILSSAGATPGQTFTSLGTVGEVYNIRESARTIIKNVEFLGEDIVSSIDKESKNTPSQDYAAFLQGYIATLRTGGDLQPYLMTMSEKFMESRRRLLTKMINQLDLAGELFVAVLVALPVILITMLSIMGFFGGEVLVGLDAPQVMTLMTYIFIPFIAIGIIIFIDSIMSGW